jgi:hypothetical protein
MIINLCFTIRHPVVTTTVICVSLTPFVSLDDVNYIHIYTVKPERLRRYEGSNDLSDLLRNPRGRVVTGPGFSH